LTHNLEIQHNYFTDISAGIKSFEIRRTNRDYKVGDILILKSLKTNETIKKQIKYICDLSIYDIDHILILGI
tara:strand:+ start:1788 stop:2003 length:216 start_codon:yes stop_codon:yes gene_type:complete